MYHLYVSKCKEENRKIKCKTLYIELFFAHDQPFWFHTPRKDQCPICNHYKQLVLDGLVTEENHQKSGSMNEKMISLDEQDTHELVILEEDDDPVENI